MTTMPMAYIIPFINVLHGVFFGLIIMKGGRMAKLFDELEFTDDFMFCKVLINNEDICKELIELIVGRKVKEIIGLEDQKSIQITGDGKGVRLDVYFEDQDSVVYNLEMQNKINKHIPRRSRYYQGMVDLDILNRGDDYKKLKDNYLIFISPEDFFGKGLCKYSFDNICNEDKSIKLDDGAHKVFICSKGDRKAVSEKLGAFLDYVGGKKSDNGFIRRIESAVEEIRRHDEWRAEYMTLLDRYREEREEGREEGREESLLESVRNLMKNMSLSCEEAMKALEIPESEFQKYMSRI